LLISVNNLPSKGKGYKVPEIELRPLGYTKLLEYSETDCKTPGEKLLRDIKYLVTDIKGWESFHMYDLKQIIFMRKIISITTNPEIKLEELVCPKCHEKFSQSLPVGMVHFTPIPEITDKIKAVKLNGKEYPLNLNSTVKDFYDCLTLYASRGYLRDMKIIYLSTILNMIANPNEIEEVLNTATYEDVRSLEVLYQYSSGMMSPVEIIHNGCGGDVMVQFDNLIVNLFRTVLLNNQIDESSFVLFEGV